MRQRSLTTTILIALLTCISPAAYVLWSLQQQTFATIDAERRVAGHADAIAETLSSIATAQQGYVAPGQLDEPLFDETAVLLSRLVDQVNAFAPMLRSGEAAARLEPLRDAMAALQAADARTRENLIRGQELMAADVIYSDGRNVVAAITEHVREAQAAEQATATASYTQAARWTWVLFGLVTLISVSAFAIVLNRSRRAASPAATEALAPASAKVPEAAEPVGAAQAIDHAALAALCTDVARAGDVPALERAFERAARLLDAVNVMLWMRAGTQLFPALAHGYAADALPRLKPIASTADNAAAAAWQTGKVVRQMPVAEDAGAALVAPLFSPDAVIGVLAVELRRGHLPDVGREAAVTVLAAQLSTVVSAWPAGGVPQSSRPSEARTA